MNSTLVGIFGVLGLLMFSLLPVCLWLAQSYYMDRLYVPAVGWLIQSATCVVGGALVYAATEDTYGILNVYVRFICGVTAWTLFWSWRGERRERQWHDTYL